MKTFNTLLVALFLTGFSFAQDVEWKASNFKDKKEEFKVALEQKKKGDEYLLAGNEAVYSVTDPGNNFKAAIIEFKKANKFNPNSAEVNFKLGNAYLYTNEKYKALEYLTKAEKLNPEVDDFLDFYLGMAKQLDMDFSGALKHYTKFESSTKAKQVATLGPMVSKRKKECKHGKELTAKPIRAWIDNVSAINSDRDDFSPCISTDGATIVFTSTRENGHNANEVGDYDGDIYITELVNGKWSKAKNVGEPLSTKNYETATMLSYDGTKMLMYKLEEENYDVYESKLKGTKWSTPTKLHRSLNTKANQTQASYSYNNRKIYFVSDKKMGSAVRGTDIYTCGRMNGVGNTEFGAAQNVGNEVNSKFNEGSVYLHPNGDVMYFSSEGHNSMGGMDIFMSKKRGGQWQEPVNLGYPINTPYDDFFFASTASGKFAYIASNREGGKGNLDIYKVTFWGDPKEMAVETEDYLLASVANPIQDVQIESKVKVDKKALTVFKGKTIDAITKKPVEAKMEIVDNSTGKKIEDFTTNSATGKFLLSLNAGRNYGIAVERDGYLFHSENFDISSATGFNMVNKVIELYNIKVGSKIALRNVFFASGKSTLTPDSNAELDRLVKLLKDVPGLKIELSGHTDNVGSESMNKKLSQDRAQAVVNYLINKGIDSKRLSAKGYGSSQPIASNNTSEGRQENRRTEFLITGN